jgi:carbon monoxide dehydrogenase subunit G
MPGAELGEVVDPDTFKGKVKIKVGPITVAYNGTARISEKDDAARRAVLAADGRETTGPGSARATATMSVVESAGGSTVRLSTDYTVAGRVANFGRGVMEDVSRRLVSQMADCIKEHLEASEPEAPEAPAAAEATIEAGTEPAAGLTEARQAGPMVSPPQAKPVNALSLGFSVLWERIKRLFGGGRSA